MTGRTVPEWIGKTPDAKIPDRVRLRVFAAHGGICWLSGRKIMPSEAWDCDHKIALINGGENRESNLAPALRDKHRAKTKADVREKSETATVRKKHLGIKTKAKGRPMAGTVASGLRHKMNGTWERR